MKRIFCLILCVLATALSAKVKTWHYENTMITEYEREEIILRQHGGKPVPELSEVYCLLVNGCMGVSKIKAFSGR